MMTFTVFGGDGLIKYQEHYQHLDEVNSTTVWDALADYVKIHGVNANFTSMHNFFEEILIVEEDNMAFLNDEVTSIRIEAN